MVIRQGKLYKHEKEKDKLWRQIRGESPCWTINITKLNSRMAEINEYIYKTEKFVYKIPAEIAHLKGVTMKFGREMKLCVPCSYWLKEAV